jgi:predicted lysophospholipase L1 biosynthesis ABC-type transport system permease subunit
LVTYRLVVRRSDVEGEAHSLRSSIWKAINGRWQMIFHQGTLAGLEQRWSPGGSDDQEVLDERGH